MFKVLFVGLLFNALLTAQNNKGIISGTVTNGTDGKPLHGCNVIITETSEGTTTNSEGKFSISIAYGVYTIKISYVGFQPAVEKVALSAEKSQVNLTIGLLPSAVETKEVTVTGDKEPPSTIIMEVKEKELKRMPNVYHDVMRTVQVLPGVTTNSELSSGYNVRGGNFDNNLIYLNGYEIYRPFLLRQGMEENQTLISPDLANQLRFFNGAFPATYGDKMSSALDVNYNLNNLDSLSGTLKFDVANAGFAIKQKFGDLKVGVSSRYSYPGLFLGRLHADGDYRPEFYDFQLIADYKLNETDNLGLFLLYANNTFDLSPDILTCHINTDITGKVYNGIDIFYNGNRTYSFKTALAGLNFNSRLNNDLLFEVSAAFYSTSEKENSDLDWNTYYFEVVDEVRIVNDYLKSGAENVSNMLDLNSWQINPSLEYKFDNHLLTAGFDLRFTNIKSRLDENFVEIADSGMIFSPFNRYISQDYSLDTYSAYLQDEFTLTDNLLVNAGLRMTYCRYNKEFLTSPRVNILYNISPIHTITLSWGYYYQPPYYSELRNKPDVNEDKLLAQRAIQYSAGWEFKFKEKVKFNLEAYYSNLDNLIPYYIDREKLEYLEGNSNEGYAYGFDATFQGEITSGLNSWVSYAYLDTKERKKNSDENYRRRLTDQTHTIQVFLQDKIKKHPNWQSHVRFIVGSGYLFNLYETKTDPETGRIYMQTSADKVNEFLMYFRMDMGLSAAYNFGGYKFTFVAEVLNVFNHLNYGGYNFIQITTKENVRNAFYIPKVLSRRFFNLGVEITI